MKNISNSMFKSKKLSQSKDLVKSIVVDAWVVEEEKGYEEEVDCCQHDALKVVLQLSVQNRRDKKSKHLFRGLFQSLNRRKDHLGQRVQ